MVRNFPDWSVQTLLANRDYDLYVIEQSNAMLKEYESTLFNTRRLARGRRNLIRNLKATVRKINEDLAELGCEVPVNFGDDEGTP